MGTRTKIIAGNWKMNTSLADAHVLAAGIRNGVEHIERVETVVCPPSIWLTEIAHEYIPKRAHVHLKLGAQNMYFEESGAYTGEISPLMVKEVAEYVILGHSERTHIFREDLDLIAHKLDSAFDHKLLPILCVGEDNPGDVGQKSTVKQLHRLTSQLDEYDLRQLVVAYEPVWAIGTGKAATPDYAQEVMALLRQEVSPATRILYGGSVNEENAKGFLELPDCDGMLIGGTSLKLKPFLTICQFADDVAQKQGHTSLHT